MKLPPLSFTILDTETTGFVPRTHRVIEFASIRVEGGKIVDEYEELFFIESEIPPVVQMLTRIRPKDLQGKPTFGEKKEEILKHIGQDTVIVGQNVGFDIGMLKGEGVDLSDRPWIDTSMLASVVYPECASYSLGYLSATLKLRHEPVHRALGDVRATLELLSKCYERFGELTPGLMSALHEVAEKTPEGYRRFFHSIPAPTAKKTPAWLTMPAAGSLHSAAIQSFAHAVADPPDEGTVLLAEEPIDPGVLTSIVEEAGRIKSRTHWIAVKNLEATLSRMNLPETCRAIFPPFLLLDREAEKRFLAQDAYTNDEATLVLKLRWYKPRTQADFPIHGEELSVWNGKLACTDQSATYKDQFKDLPGVLLLDHRQILAFIGREDAAEADVMGRDAHVIIDDASMLEDTATKALGWYCSLDTLRAAAEGITTLTRFLDVLQIWIERTRQFQDVRYIVPRDLDEQDSKGMRDLLAKILKEESFTPQVRRQLTELSCMLDPARLSGRIAWMESDKRSSQSLQSVPERVSTVLKEKLYDQYATTLLIPPGSAETLREILPAEQQKTVITSPSALIPLRLSCVENRSLEGVLGDPPAGKTIVLVSSKRIIEDCYVRHTEHLEEKKVTLICQGMSGGQSRMQAEFLAAEGNVLWLLTPWSYEGIDLPEGSVDQLFVHTLPFDHPSHTVLSRRAEHFRDPFNEYSLPRLMHRVFRLLRTFARHKKEAAEVIFLDDRLFAKEYGRRIRTWLDQFATEPKAAPTKPVAEKPKTVKKKGVKITKKDGQLPLFG